MLGKALRVCSSLSGAIIARACGDVDVQSSVLRGLKPGMAEDGSLASTQNTGRKAADVNESGGIGNLSNDLRLPRSIGNG